MAMEMVSSGEIYVLTLKKETNSSIVRTRSGCRDVFNAYMCKNAKYGTHDIYEFVYDGKIQRIAVQVGNNGYIVGANLRSNEG